MENLEKIKKKLEKKYSSNNPVLYYLSIVLVLTALVLGFLIYAKKDENGKLLKEYFNVNVSFVEMNKNISSFFKSLTNFNIFFNNDNETQLVNSTNYYTPIGDNYYISEDSQIRMLNHGTILYKTEEENGYAIIVNYNNGVIATYFEIKTPLVNRYDQLDKGDVFGSYANKFKVLFNKNNKLITYEEALL